MRRHPDVPDDLRVAHDAQAARGAGTGRAPYAHEIIGNEEPPYEAVGLAALSPILRHVPFPATKQDVVAAIGDVRIPVSRRQTRTVRELLDLAAPERFRTQADLEGALARRWGDLAEGRGGHEWQRDNLSGRGMRR